LRRFIARKGALLRFAIQKESSLAALGMTTLFL
jgi:hypothetical protein